MFLLRVNNACSQYAITGVVTAMFLIVILSGVRPDSLARSLPNRSSRRRFARSVILSATALAPARATEAAPTAALVNRELEALRARSWTRSLSSSLGERRRIRRTRRRGGGTRKARRARMSSFTTYPLPSSFFPERLVRTRARSGPERQPKRLPLPPARRRTHLLWPPPLRTTASQPPHFLSASTPLTWITARPALSASANSRTARTSGSSPATRGTSSTATASTHGSSKSPPSVPFVDLTCRRGRRSQD